MSAAADTRALMAETADFLAADGTTETQSSSSNQKTTTTTYETTTYTTTNNIISSNGGTTTTYTSTSATGSPITTDYNALWQAQKEKMLKYSTLAGNKEGRITEKQFIQTAGRRARPSLKIDWGKANAKLPIGQTEDMLAFRNSLYETFDKQNLGHLTMADTIRGARDVLMLEEAVVQGDEEILWRTVVPLAFERAAKAATAHHATHIEHSDYTLERIEFRLLLVYIRHYLKFYCIFDDCDMASTGTLDLNEFKASLPGLEAAGAHICPDPELTFQEMDPERHGEITFERFVEYFEADGLASRSVSRSRNRGVSFSGGHTETITSTKTFIPGQATQYSSSTTVNGDRSLSETHTNGQFGASTYKITNGATPTETTRTIISGGSLPEPKVTYTVIKDLPSDMSERVTTSTRTTDYKLNSTYNTSTTTAPTYQSTTTYTTLAKPMSTDELERSVQRLSTDLNKFDNTVHVHTDLEAITDTASYRALQRRLEISQQNLRQAEQRLRDLEGSSDELSRLRVLESEWLKDRAALRLTVAKWEQEANSLRIELETIRSGSVRTVTVESTSHKRELDEARSRITSLEMQLAHQQSEASRLRQIESDWARQRSEMQVTIDRYRTERDSLQTQVTSIHSRSVHTTHESDEMRRDLEAALRRATDAEAQADSAWRAKETELERWRRAEAEWQSKLQQQLDEALARTDAALAEKDAELGRLRMFELEWTKERDALQAALQRAEAEASNTEVTDAERRARETLEEENRRLREEIRSLREQIEGLKAESKARETFLGERETTIRELQERITVIEVERGSEQRQSRAIQQQVGQVDSLEREIAELREEMEREGHMYKRREASLNEQLNKLRSENRDVKSSQFEYERDFSSREESLRAEYESMMRRKEDEYARRKNEEIRAMRTEMDSAWQTERQGLMADYETADRERRQLRSEVASFSRERSMWSSEKERLTSERLEALERERREASARAAQMNARGASVASLGGQTQDQQRTTTTTTVYETHQTAVEAESSIVALRANGRGEIVAKPRGQAASVLRYESDRLTRDVLFNVLDAADCDPSANDESNVVMFANHGNALCCEEHSTHGPITMQAMVPQGDPKARMRAWDVVYEEDYVYIKSVQHPDYFLARKSSKGDHFEASVSSSASTMTDYSPNGSDLTLVHRDQRGAASKFWLNVVTKEEYDTLPETAHRSGSRRRTSRSSSYSTKYN